MDKLTTGMDKRRADGLTIQKTDKAGWQVDIVRWENRYRER